MHDGQAGGAGVAASETPAFFSGQGWPLARILAKGALLQILTLGLYRCWTLTNYRQYLWSNTRIGNDGLAYTGTPRELLVGLILDLAILGMILGLFLTIDGLDQTRLAYAGLALFATLHGYAYVRKFRARRYRVSRTHFRNRRFTMSGSAFGYAWRGMLWDLATVLSLGLAYPWRRAALDRYVMGHARYGNIPGAFAGEGRRLFKQLFPLWLIAAAMLILPSLPSLLAPPAAPPSPFFHAPSSTAQISSALFVILAPFIACVAAALVTRWRVSGIRFGALSLRSTLPLGTMLHHYIRFSIFLLIACAIFIWILMTTLQFYQIDTNISLQEAQNAPLSHILLVVFVFWSALTVIHAIQLYFFNHRIWRSVAASLVVIDLDVLQGAGESQGGSGSLEGLSSQDALSDIVEFEA